MTERPRQGEGGVRGSSESASKTQGPCCRSIAAEVLFRVFSDGAYAAPALSAALTRSRLGPKDRGLATELTYGVLRTEGYLRRRIERHAKWAATDPVVRLHLLLGTYQIDFLDRVPAHAAVSESVRLVREAKGARVAGFANAVLRNLLRDRQEFRLSRTEAAIQSVPSFLRKRLIRDVGEEEMQRLLAPGEVPPPTLRVRPGRTLDLSEGQAEHISGGAFRFLAGGDPRRDEGFARGDFVVQELGAQRVAEALRVLPGERVLDVCAGRGQKSSLLVDQGARVLATDLHPHKLSQLEDEFDRLGLECETAVHDWTTAPPLAWQGAFDAVLVDAPCSGVGTLRRRPEILRRIGPETPARLAELQEAILRQASLTLAEGGRLLFATCSVLREEGEEVVQRIADVLVPRPFASSDPSGAGQEALFRLLPGKDGTDGYFLAQLERRPGTRSL